MYLSIVSALLLFGFPFIKTDVVDSFSKCSQFFLEGKPPVIPDILKDSAAQNSNRYKLICQQYQNAVRFATLYDTTNKIPTFSAYKYTGKGNFTKPHSRFRIEPELKDDQAKNSDYRNNIQMTRGHLFPSGHAVDLDTAKSTFTLTNAVPQEKTFNEVTWNQKKNNFKIHMDNNCINVNNKVEAYVVTGVIPGDKKLNDKVNIPSHMWMAYCCYNKNTGLWDTKAYCGTNEEKSTAAFNGESLAALQNFLKEKLKKNNVQLFSNKCK